MGAPRCDKHPDSDRYTRPGRTKSECLECRRIRDKARRQQQRAAGLIPPLTDAQRARKAETDRRRNENVKIYQQFLRALERERAAS